MNKEGLKAVGVMWMCVAAATAATAGVVAGCVWLDYHDLAWIPTSIFIALLVAIFSIPVYFEFSSDD